jgi:hypothetical protein
VWAPGTGTELALVWRLVKTTISKSGSPDRTLGTLRVALALLPLFLPFFLPLFLPFLAGCSLVFVDGPPSMHRSLGYFDCTSSQLAPVADLIIGGAEGLAAASTLSDEGYRGNSAGVAPLGVAAAFVASGIYGYYKVSACKQAKAELMVRSMDRTATSSPPGLSAPPPATDPWLAPGTSAGSPWRAPASVTAVPPPTSAPNPPHFLPALPSSPHPSPPSAPPVAPPVD